ncbi:hypothetical protein [Uliginosibacterium gangwonense]|uniref:hypothetical protein n=1 Tax=Uliginosibacterium gangwonense TaxID=392736 RepID=UPI0012F79F0F|nr:hypothetical protein [Uliginosibacterium gangwonense]
MLATKKEISDHYGNAVYIKGYLLFTIESGKDLAALARENDSMVVAQAEGCRSHIKMDVRSWVYANDPSHNLVIVSYKHTGINPYNIAIQPEDICLEIGLGENMNLFKNSKVRLRYVITDELLQSIRVFDREDGVAVYQLDDKCQFSLCMPQYGPHEIGYSP